MSAVLAFAIDARDADACAIAPPLDNVQVPIEIAEESALIIWDPATKTEQFIRRAAFRSGAPAFGFLVPAPTVPVLAETSDGIFHDLERVLVPEYRTVNEGFEIHPKAFLLESCLLAKGGDKAATAPSAAVNVLQTARVAGFDATTVRADDPQALAAWLGEHGFAATPQLTEWLARYTDNKWTITAFVVAADAQKGQVHDVATRAVKMTFQTERPFYPYREPRTSQPPTVGSRLLRVFFVGDARYAATLGDAPWSASVAFAGKTEDPSIQSNQILTVFEDKSYPRNAIDEIYFARSADASNVTVAPIIHKRPHEILLPIDLIIIAGCVVFWLVRRRARRRAQATGRPRD